MGYPLYGVYAIWGVRYMGCPLYGVYTIWGVRGVSEYCRFSVSKSYYLFPSSTSIVGSRFPKLLLHSFVNEYCRFYLSKSYYFFLSSTSIVGSRFPKGITSFLCQRALSVLGFQKLLPLSFVNEYCRFSVSKRYYLFPLSTSIVGSWFPKVITSFLCQRVLSVLGFQKVLPLSFLNEYYRFSVSKSYYLFHSSTSIVGSRFPKVITSFFRQRVFRFYVSKSYYFFLSSTNIVGSLFLKVITSFFRQRVLSVLGFQKLLLLSFVNEYCRFSVSESYYFFLSPTSIVGSLFPKVITSFFRQRVLSVLGFQKLLLFSFVNEYYRFSVSESYYFFLSPTSIVGSLFPKVITSFFRQRVLSVLGFQKLLPLPFVNEYCRFSVSKSYYFFPSSTSIFGSRFPKVITSFFRQRVLSVLCFQKLLPLSFVNEYCRFSVSKTYYFFLSSTSLAGPRFPKVITSFFRQRVLSVLGFQKLLPLPFVNEYCRFSVSKSYYFFLSSTSIFGSMFLKVIPSFFRQRVLSVLCFQMLFPLDWN